MAVTSDESAQKTTSHPTRYPAPGSRYGVFPWTRIDPMWESPKGAIPYAANLTPSRPSVKREPVPKSPFSARKLALALFFTSA